MKHLDLFSGIGGFALAVDAVWPGAKHVFCDNDPFCQAVLRKHFPSSKIYEDIRALTNTRSEKLGGIPQQPWQAPSEDRTYDLITGGFPCQPFSHAGRRKGTADNRHLWPEMRRVIQEFSPHYVVGENVRGLLSIDGGVVFESVCADLEALGYEVQTFVIPACAIGAPHRRDRVWIIGHAKHDGQSDTEGREGHGERTGEPSRAEELDAPHPDGSRREGARSTRSGRNGSAKPSWSEDWPQVATRLCTLDDGLRSSVVRPDGSRDAKTPRPKGWRNAALKAAGNAIVPQVAMQIMLAIKSMDDVV